MDSSNFKQAWALLKEKERRRVFSLLFIVFIAAIANIVMIGSVIPFLTVLSDPDRIESSRQLLWFYRNFNFTSEYQFLIALGGLSLCAVAFATIVLMLRSYMLARYASLLIHSISRRLFTLYLSQPYEFFIKKNSSEIVKNILSESQEVVRLFFRPAIELVASTVSTVLVLSFLIWTAPVAALVSFSALGIVYLTTFAIVKPLVKKFGQKRRDANNSRYTIANEVFDGIKELKIIGQEDRYVESYSRPSLVYARSELAASIISNLPFFLVQATALGGIILLCIFLIDAETFASESTVADILPLLGVFAFAGQRLVPEISRIYTSSTQLQYGAAAVAEIGNQYSLTKYSISDTSSFDAKLTLDRNLSFRNVRFDYPEARRTGLSDVFLTIKAGEKIGIVGPTGAGKTTLVDLLLGLLRPSSGEILVDNEVITESNLRSWQRGIGYVPQDIFISDATVTENIALGMSLELIDETRILASAKIASIHDFIVSNLPNKYATKLGEKGVRLSGGQKQRIGIARAIYHGENLIVFDEATSALDNETEREIMKAVEAIPGNRTLVMIAHRLSTLSVCDRIVVLRDGKVEDFGEWDVLINRSKTFQMLASAK
ncbi:MAG: ABC transporter ATP-binding protein [Pseudomonadota bacterium]